MRCDSAMFGEGLVKKNVFSVLTSYLDSVVVKKGRTQNEPVQLYSFKVGQGAERKESGSVAQREWRFLSVKIRARSEERDDARGWLQLGSEIPNIPK